MTGTLLQILRIVAVLSLVAVATALATPPGRLPLALRGLQKLLSGRSTANAEKPASAAKRFAAFILIILAVLIALAKLPFNNTP